MFETIEVVPGDPILGLTKLFNDDANPDKVDLGVGVYRDDAGHTPVMRAVKMAEQHLVDTQQTKTYVSPQGIEAYSRHMLRLVLGVDSSLLDSGQALATQAPGGTGALYLAAAFIRKHLPQKTLWIPDPTWPNHVDVFSETRVAIQRYPYPTATHQLDFDAVIAAIRQIPQGDVLLLHGCCHNPTGFDFNRQQWQELLHVIQERQLLPLLDLAYQGFGDGLAEDAYGVRLLAENLDACLIAQSNSKNFGMYRDRVGNLMIITDKPHTSTAVHSQIGHIARTKYSIPPTHGAEVIATIFDSAELHDIWEQELTHMRSRIHNMRAGLVREFAAHGLEQHFAFINAQRGMFSFTGLDAEQVKRLREEYSIYMVASGRANIAGLRQENIPYVCQAIAAVMA